MNHDGFSAEHKFKILKRCFEGTENIRDVAIDEKVSRIIYIHGEKGILSTKCLDCNKKKQIKRTASIEELKADHSTDNGEKSSDKSASSEDIALLKKQIKELQMKVDVMTEVFEI